MKEFNLQLWSLKSVLSRDLDGGFEFMKKIGVSGIELYSDFSLSKEEMKAKVKNYGFKVVSSHVGISRMRENLMGELDFLSYLDCSEIVCPYGEIYNTQTAKIYAEELNEYGRICKENGFSLSYHNHANEFKFDRGMYPLDVFYQNTDPVYVKAQLDVYWINYADVDEYKYVEKYKNRINSIHLKQGDIDKNSVDASDGIIDFDKIIKMVPDSVIPIYEQEFNQGVSEEAVKKSLEHSAKFFNKEGLKI